MKTPILCGMAACVLLRTGILAQPVITTEPVDKVATVWGDRITLSVSATGTEPISYQWHFKDQPLAGRTNTLLVLTNVTFADSGPYHVTVQDVSGLVPSRVAMVTVPAPAVLDPKIGTNLRLGSDPDLLPANRRAQVSPHIARSFRDPNLILVAFQEGRFENGGSSAAGRAFSKDGGLTWNRELLPELTTINGGPYPRAVHSVVAVDRNDHLYVIHNTGPAAEPKPTITALQKSTDGGRTFGSPGTVIQKRGEMDKPWIAINTQPGTPTTDRISVLCNVFGVGQDFLHLTFSDDGGSTWSPAEPVGPDGAVYGQNLFLQDGSLGIVYFHYLDNLFEPTAQGQIEYIHSPDGGRTFEKAVVVAPMTGRIYHDPVARDAWDEPSACTDRQAGIIYVTFQGLKETGGTHRVPGIFFTRSIDQGRTWTAPIAVNDTPSGAGVFNPCIAAAPDGQHVMIAFYDKRHNTPTSGGNLTDYYLAESFDGGATWQPNLRLSDVSSDLRKAPLTGIGRMFADYQGIVPALNEETPGVAVWIDTRTGNPDPFAVRIHRTQGSTYEAWSSLRFDPKDVTTLGAAESDPDEDGFSNRAEYVFGGSPNVPDHALLAIQYRSRIGGIEIRYSRFDVAPYDSMIVWSRSLDLREWQTFSGVGDVIEIPSENPAVSRLTLSLPLEESAQFYRPFVRSKR